MKILFIDSSRKSLSIALANEDKLIFVSNVNSYSKHSNFLLNEIAKQFENINMSIKDIDGIVVLNGPGSFTGIRVGVTIAKTLAWALNKKLYVINNLKALSLSFENDIVISIINDKETASYVGIYDDSIVTEDYLSITDEKLNIRGKNITIVGMENEGFTKTLANKLSMSNEVSFKMMEEYDYLKIIQYCTMKEAISPHLAEPIYIKKIDVEKK